MGGRGDVDEYVAFLKIIIRDYQVDFGVVIRNLVGMFF